MNQSVTVNKDENAEMEKVSKIKEWGEIRIDLGQKIWIHNQ